MEPTRTHVTMGVRASFHMELGLVKPNDQWASLPPSLHESWPSHRN